VRVGTRVKRKGEGALVRVRAGLEPRLVDAREVGGHAAGQLLLPEARELHPRRGDGARGLARLVRVRARVRVRVRLRVRVRVRVRVRGRVRVRVRVRVPVLRVHRAIRTLDVLILLVRGRG